MNRFRSFNRFAAVVIAATLAINLFAIDAVACKVPVFRYALERWPADPYRIVAIVDGPPTDEQNHAIAALNAIQATDVNVVTEIVKLDTLSDAELWSVEGLESTDQAPLLQVFYPERGGQRKLCWSGQLTTANVKAWIDSPLRQAIVQDIRSGCSAVWVLVDGPDDAQNERLLAELEAALATATQAISIPEGVIPRRDAASYLRKNTTASMDDVLRCDIPLQINFSIERLKRDDPNERSLRAIIDGWTQSVDAPFVFPVFGRGRMIEPLAASEFQSTAVMAACRYLVGECSCSVKALNPGIDLILHIDWQKALGDQIVMVDVAGKAEPQSLAIPPGSPSDPNSDVALEPAEAIEPAESLERKQADEGKFWVVVLIGLAALAFWLKLRMGVQPNSDQ